MRLPAYSGPFQVGCVDLEVPVRRPRSYGTDVVPPHELNKPKYVHPLRSTLRRWLFQRRGKDGVHRRGKAYSLWLDLNCTAFTEDHSHPPATPHHHHHHRDTHRHQAKRVSRVDTARSARRSSHGQQPGAKDNTSTKARHRPWHRDVSYGVDEEGDDPSAFNPFSYNSKTSTLHLETVLFTLYYPTSHSADASPLPAASYKYKYRYSPATWVGRPLRSSVGGLLGYLRQYGLLGLLASPAVASLMNAELPVHVGAPLASPADERMAAIARVRPMREEEKQRAQRQREKRSRQDHSPDYDRRTLASGRFSRWFQGKAADPPPPMQPSGVPDPQDAGEKGYSIPEGAPDPVFESVHNGRQLPVMIFSHGLAGSRTSYSQYCGTLASHGVLVAALEHRDGSALHTYVRSSRPGRRAAMKAFRNKAAAGATAAESSSEGGKEEKKEHEPVNPSQPAGEQLGKVHTEQPGQEEGEAIEDENERNKEAKFWEDVKMYKDSKYARRYGSGFGGGRLKKKRMGYLHPRNADVPQLLFEKFNLRSFPTDPTEEEAGLRAAQIQMRIDEIEECRHVLERINQGEGYHVYLESTRGLGSKLAKRRHFTPPPESIVANPMQLGDWEGKLDLQSVFLVGHSFGGCTVAEAQRHIKRPFPSALILDPWTEPMSEGGPPIQQPLFAINSETFTVWQESFDKLKRICHDARDHSDARGWILTVAGTDHLSFSDLPIILPHLLRSAVNPQKSIAIYALATYTQMGLLHQRNHRPLPLTKQSFDAAVAAVGKARVSHAYSEKSRELAAAVPAGERKSQQNDAQTSSGTPRTGNGGGGVIAHRSPSGNLVTEERRPSDPVDFVDGAQLIEAIQHVEQVHHHDEGRDGAGARASESTAVPALRPGSPETHTSAKREMMMVHSPEPMEEGGSPTTAGADGGSGSRKGKEDVWDCDDALEVLKRTQAISDSIASTKKHSILSLLGLMMSSQGLKVGELSTPGTILVHQYCLSAPQYRCPSVLGSRASSAAE